jgi:hypothetical protein
LGTEDELSSYRALKVGSIMFYCLLSARLPLVYCMKDMCTHSWCLLLILFYVCGWNDVLYVTTVMNR